MIQTLKNWFYFPIAWYFRIFATIRLHRWQPRIIVITGSSGKTTFLHLVEAVLSEKARYSHKANSSFGIPFDILGFHRTELTILEWLGLFLSTPFYAFKSPPKEKLYIVEVDCDRPYEGDFLGSLLKPEVVMWSNVSRTHAMNFDLLVASGRFVNVEEAIAYEYGRVLSHCQKEIFVNADSPLIIKQLLPNWSEIVYSVKKDNLQAYSVSKAGTKFKIDNHIYQFNYLLPENVYYAIAMTIELARYLGEKEVSFRTFVPPPGRSSILSGIKNTTLVDSSYNSNLDSAIAVLDMYDRLNTEKKWAVLGDMLEQGEGERQEHEKLAERIVRSNLDHIVLMGPRVKKYTYPRLKELIDENIPLVVFETPREVLDYLQNNIKGGETILFKGARYLEGVVACLLANKDDVSKLCRREKIYEIRRRHFGV